MNKLGSGIIIAVSGGPGIGKSFLVRRLADYYQAIALFEGEEKDFPEAIKEGIKTGHKQVNTRLYFRNKTFAQFLEAQKHKQAGQIVFLDNFWLTNEIYGQAFLSDEAEKKLIAELNQLDRQILAWPDLTISLSASPEKIREYVLARARSFENEADYLSRHQMVHDAHDEYFKNCPEDNILLINRSELDFKNEADFAWLVKTIEEKLSKHGKTN